MKKARKTAYEVRGPRTFGELVTLAFDICPNRTAAVKLLGQLLRGGLVQVGNVSSTVS